MRKILFTYPQYKCSITRSMDNRYFTLIVTSPALRPPGPLQTTYSRELIAAATLQGQLAGTYEVVNGLCKKMLSGMDGSPVFALTCGDQEYLELACATIHYFFVDQNDPQIQKFIGGKPICLRIQDLTKEASGDILQLGVDLTEKENPKVRITLQSYPIEHSIS